MPIPTASEFILPVLRLIASGHRRIPDCIPPLIREFSLTVEEAEELTPSGLQTKLANRIGWSRHLLSKAGLVRVIRHGEYVITDKGTEVLADPSVTLDRKLLVTLARQLEEARDAEGVTSVSQSHSDDADSIVEQNADAPPEELLASAYSELTNALADDLLDNCLDLSPTRFEKLIVDLLIAMGFGGGDERMGHQLGKSHDGGIDGVIDEDALGLDAVYVQAKRYALDNTVGRPAIQQFIGSLTGEGATKGVFVTTSSFSREARDYAARVMQRVVLIDGRRLARLMIRYGVGVRVRETYEVKSVDEDYFGDPL